MRFLNSDFWFQISDFYILISSFRVLIFELLTLISALSGLKIKYFISIISELKTALRLIYDFLDFKIRKKGWPQSTLILKTPGGELNRKVI